MKFQSRAKRKLAECAASFYSAVSQLNSTSAGRGLCQNDLSGDSCEALSSPPAAGKNQSKLLFFRK